MIDYYRLFNIVEEVPEKVPIEPVKPIITMDSEKLLVYILILLSASLILILFSIFLWEKLSTVGKILTLITIMIPVLLIIPTSIITSKTAKYEKEMDEYNKKYESFKKYEEHQREFNEILELLKIKTDKNKMKQEMEKLKKFCKIYYSPKDPSFCKDNEVNEYTVNMVFRRIYENDRSFEDAENAMKYIYSGN